MLCALQCKKCQKYQNCRRKTGISHYVTRIAALNVYIEILASKLPDVMAFITHIVAYSFLCPHF